jgi:hypothetical protein
MACELHRASAVLVHVRKGEKEDGRVKFTK